MRARSLLLLTPLLIAAALFLYVRSSRTVPANPPGPSGPSPAADREPPAERPQDPTETPRSAEAAARSIAAPPPVEEPVIELPRSALVTVVDGKNEEPIPGASVRWTQDEVTGESSTDESGVAPLALDLLGARTVLHVEAAGYLPAQRSLDPRRELRIELHRPGIRLRGLVVEAETGVPIPAARILSRGAGTESETRTDSRGTYLFEGLPEGVMLSFVVIASDFPAHFAGFRIEPGVTERAYDFRLEHGHRFQGRVVDADTSTGIPNATLTSQWVRDEVHVAAADGSFDVEYLPNSNGHGDSILVEAPGYCSLRVHLPHESHTDVSFPLVRPAWIEGVVRSGESPVEGAEIRFWRRRAANVTSREGWPEPRLLGNTTHGVSTYTPSVPIDPTDSRGNFRGELVPLGPHGRSDLDVVVDAPGFAKATATVPLPASGEVQRVEFDLEPETRTATVHGSVFLNGDPAEGLLAWHVGSKRGNDPVEHGVFRIEELPDGHLVLTFRPLGLPLAPSELVAGLRLEVDLAAGADVRVDFELTSEVGEIAGRVVTTAGTPVAGQQVRANLGQMWVRAATDPLGEYRFTLPNVGKPYKLSCHRALVGEVEDVELGSTVDFVLPVFGEVRVRAEDADTGQAIPRFTLSWLPAGEYAEPTTAVLRGPDSDGWSVASLPVGKIDVRVGATRYVVSTVADLEITPSTSTPDLVLSLQRWSSVSLELAEDCLPVPADHHVFLVEEHMWRDLRFEPFPGGALPTIDGRDLDVASRRTVRFDANRIARLSGVGEGVLRFKTIPNDIVIEPAVVVLPLAEPGPVPVRWSWRKP